MPTKHIFVLIHIRKRVSLVSSKLFKPPSNFLPGLSKASFVDPFLCFVFVCYTVMSTPCSFAVTCWDKTDLLALLGAAGLSLTGFTALCP